MSAVTPEDNKTRKRQPDSAPKKGLIDRLKMPRVNAPKMPKVVFQQMPDAGPMGM